MKKIGILFNSRIAAAGDLALELQKALGKSKIKVWSCVAYDEAMTEAMLEGTDMIISLGGDGTVLRAARLAAPQSIPILCVNLGNLGFTTELTGQEAQSQVPRFLAGEGWVDERAMLQAELPLKGGPLTIHALNDVVVGRGSVMRVIRVKASTSGQPITTYKGDGVIVATATGSTGYSLAAGGPILFPNAREIILTPISSHLGLAAALVLSGESIIELEVQTTHEARVSIDGQIEFPLNSGDVVRVRRSPYTARLLRIQPRPFFHETLLKRLSGKGG
ncbi:MAG: NAD(+)/NADH kinase [Dehalococcoidia bacterium]